MAKVKSKGTLLKLHDGSATYTTIGQVRNISGPSETRETINVSDHDTATAMEYVAAALYDAGEVTFELHFDPAHATHDNSTGLRNLIRNGTQRNYQIVFPDSGSTTFTFAAFVTAMSPEMPSEATGMLTSNVTLKLTGTITES